MDNWMIDVMLEGADKQDEQFARSMMRSCGWPKAEIDAAIKERRDAADDEGRKK